MNSLNAQITSPEVTPPIHWGHFGIIMGTIILLAAVTWMKKPEIFSFEKTNETVLPIIKI